VPHIGLHYTFIATATVSSSKFSTALQTLLLTLETVIS
jgi:hypothetical protein